MKPPFLSVLYLLLLFFASYSPVNAQQLWKKIYELDFSARAFSAVETADHDFLVLGNINTNDTFQILLMKVAPNGNLLWQKRLSGFSDNYGRGIVRTADNNFMIIANSGLYMIILKVNAEGKELWRRYIQKDREGICLDVTSDGGIVALGRYTKALNGILTSYIFVSKFDKLGNEEWSKLYFQQVDFWPEAIEQTTDGGYIIGGTHQFNISAGGFLLKLNNSGIMSWFRTYENSNFRADYFRFSTATHDGGFVLCGFENSIIQPPIQQNPDGYIIRTDSIGQQITYYLVSVANSVDVVNHIFQNKSNQFIVNGETEGSDDNRNILLALLSPFGETLQKCLFDNSNDDYSRSALETSDNNILVVGYTTSTLGNKQSPFLIKTNWQCSTTTGNLPAHELSNASVYPNPSTGVIYIDLPLEGDNSFSIELFDVYGRKLSTTVLNSISNVLNLSHLSPGIYSYHLLRNNTCLKIAKVILL